MSSRKRTKRGAKSAPPPPPPPKAPQGVTHVIAIDGEFTGMNVVENAMVEFAASYWKVGDEKPRSTFVRQIAMPEGTAWCPETAREFWDNKSRADEDGKTLREQLEERKRTSTLGVVNSPAAMRAFVEFVRACDADAGLSGYVVIISDTNELDTSFLNVYLGRYCPHLCMNLNRIFGPYRSTRDIDSFYFGIGRRINKWGAETAALDMLNERDLPDWVPPSNLHSALEDANYIGGAASYIISRCRPEEEEDKEE